jgi:sulfite exporter TauE/SafE
MVASTMFVFGLGAALPLLVLGTLSRELLGRWRDRMLDLAKGLKAALGLALIAFGLAVVLGFDKMLGTILLDASPDWLTNLTTRF